MVVVHGMIEKDEQPDLQHTSMEFELIDILRILLEEMAEIGSSHRSIQ